MVTSAIRPLRQQGRPRRLRWLLEAHGISLEVPRESGEEPAGDGRATGLFRRQGNGEALPGTGGAPDRTRGHTGDLMFGVKPA